MKAPSEFVARLRRATTDAVAVSEADVIREAQADAFQAGYAHAARELFGIALESQERTDRFLEQAGAHAAHLKSH